MRFRLFWDFSCCVSVVVWVFKERISFVFRVEAFQSYSTAWSLKLNTVRYFQMPVNTHPKTLDHIPVDAILSTAVDCLTHTHTHTLPGFKYLCLLCDKQNVNISRAVTNCRIAFVNVRILNERSVKLQVAWGEGVIGIGFEFIISPYICKCYDPVK